MASVSSLDRMKRLTRRRSGAASPSAAADSAPAPAQPGAPGDAARALVEPAAAETAPLYDSDAVIDCVVAYNKYGGYVVPRQASHRVAAKAVIEGGVYEPQTIELIRAECGEHDVRTGIRRAGVKDKAAAPHGGDRGAGGNPLAGFLVQAAKQRLIGEQGGKGWNQARHGVLPLLCLPLFGEGCDRA